MKEEKKSAWIKWSCFLALASIFGITGCASPMALTAQKDGVDLSSKSIAIFTLRTTNAYKPAYHPNVKRVKIDNSGAFKTDAAISGGRQAGEYLISVDAEPGQHTLNDVIGSSSSGLIFGSFAFPVDAGFNLQANSITYIGHVDMTNRKRKDGEPRSGSVIPLIDQAVSGYSGGTFDIVISDRYDTDIQLFVNAYPIIQGKPIHRSVMTK